MSPDAFLAHTALANRIVHDLVAAHGGSISAEHGIGQQKRDELVRYKSAVELDLMRMVKAALDPSGIMQPGEDLQVGLMKILLWIVIIVVLLLALRLWNTAKARRRSDDRGRVPTAAGRNDDSMQPVRRLSPAEGRRRRARRVSRCGEPACLRPR